MSSKWIPFLFIFAIIGIVLMIVLRDDKSFVSKIAQMISRNIEGFAPTPVLENPQCPANYKFFTDRRGDSFCCAGSINRYTHRCEVGDAQGLCAFRPNMQDPRNRHRILPLCSSLIAKNHTTQQRECPVSLPNYASVGKCCLNNPDFDGTDCIPSDNKDKKNYCKLQGPLAPGEQLCSQMNMMTSASMTCPKEIPQVVMYKTGAAEVAAYGSRAGNLPVPTCFGMNQVCIPDAAIQYYQKANGLYKDKSIPTWKYSCSGWTTTNVTKDMTVKMDRSYLPGGARKRRKRRQR
jgi:hypothetical protein